MLGVVGWFKSGSNLAARPEFLAYETYENIDRSLRKFFLIFLRRVCTPPLRAPGWRLPPFP